jgi:GxxExxY protein
MLERSHKVDRILSCAIAVHRALGPGLMESTYQHCLSYEFTLNRVAFRAQVPIPVAYRGTHVSCGYRADFIVDDEVLLELKSVEKLMPLHDAQVLTYLRLTGLPRALLLNFNVPVLKTGIKSFLNSHGPIQFPSAPDSPDRGGGSA